MSISSLRWRLVLTLGAASAAVLALAVPAGASTGNTWTSPEQAGYVITNAKFAHIAASVYLRNPAHYRAIVANYGHSVQLRSAGLVVIGGVRASTSSGGYRPYFTIYDSATHRVIASDPDARYCQSFIENPACGPYGNLAYGQTVELRITYTTDSENGQIDLEEYFSNGWGFFSRYSVGAQSFTQARVGTDFGTTPWDASYRHTAPATSVKAAVYNNVDLANYSGRWADPFLPWWVHHKLLAKHSGSDLIATPGNLYRPPGINVASFKTWLVP